MPAAPPTTIYSIENRSRFIRQNPPSSDFAENSLSNWINYEGAHHSRRAVSLGPVRFTVAPLWR